MEKEQLLLEMDIDQCFFQQITLLILTLHFITEFWKVKYYNHFTTFYDIYNSDISQKKHGAFHYLDYAVNNNLTIGLFEAIIWQSRDENFERGFDVHYLNPIIFYRPVEFSKHSPDNILMVLILIIN